MASTPMLFAGGGACICHAECPALPHDPLPFAIMLLQDDSASLEAYTP